MLIYASQRENGTADNYDFCFHQKMRNWYLGNYKREENLYPFKQEARKTK